jgi:hypothetical protein
MQAQGVSSAEALELVSSKRDTYVDQLLAAFLDRL